MAETPKDFIWVSESMQAIECGDEPLLLRKNLPDAPVAVCENRLKGLIQMKAEHPELEWVVCDDAFQHRRLKPTVSLLLLDASQPIASDSLLPAGRLRDVPERMRCADALIITRLDPKTSMLEATAAHGIAERHSSACIRIPHAAANTIELARWHRSTQWKCHAFT